MNPQARAAYERRKQQHRSELRQWQVIAGIFFALFALTSFWAASRGVWQSGDAPKEAVLYVVTRAWLNKDGQWQSFDNGEIIEVEHWTMKGATR